MQAVTGVPPTGSYSPSRIADGPFLFVSGQGPTVDGRIAGGSIAEQTRLTLQNVLAVVEAAGGSRADVVRCGVFLSDLNDFDDMDRVFGEFFGDALPTRTTVGVGLIGIRVEIDAVARLHPTDQSRSS